ncbi:MAG TPA: response regulator [Sedimentisphaerales bacterium]|nr:response regulator [Sedimentisphaerales bacterium]
MDKQFSVLVVEDEDHIRRILEYNLKLDGFDVRVAENGRKGLELVHQQHPDVILLDWMMPEMNGLEMLSVLKKDKQTENIPVFMLTARAMMQDLGTALLEGADDYIVKPFDPKDLGSTIRHKLGKMVSN